jgi:hypothetical protein
MFVANEEEWNARATNGRLAVDFRATQNPPGAIAVAKDHDEPV